MDEHIRVPYSHVGDIWLLANESLKWCDVTQTGVHGAVNGVDSSHKGISPEEVRCPSVFQKHSSLVKHPPIRVLGDPILLWGVWNGEFYVNAVFSAVGFEGLIDILPPPVSMQDLCVGVVMVGKEGIELGEPGSEVGLLSTWQE